ncbi:MAG: Ureidoglycolate lyase [Nitrospira sp.]|nr:Ureidoglycolate lyase [Nitrospira sp.]
MHKAMGWCRVMKLLRIGAPGAEKPCVLALDGRVLDASSLVADFDPAFFASDGMSRLSAAINGNQLPVVEMSDLRVGSPVARPGKIVCVGLNYYDHARETGAVVPPEPILFLKATNTLVGPYDTVLVPRGSKKTDWEIELAVIIGTRARYLGDPQEAAATIAGYAISNDISEREFQLERSGQWDKGKSCETFNPMGPWLVSSDEVGDPQSLRLRLWVNGVLRQEGNTSDMAFGVHELIWYVSQFMVLDPGDIINTGTPAGVAMGSPGEPYLRAGDAIKLAIDGLGQQKQTVEQA